MWRNWTAHLITAQEIAGLNPAIVTKYKSLIIIDISLDEGSTPSDSTKDSLPKKQGKNNKGSTGFDKEKRGW